MMRRTGLRSKRATPRRNEGRVSHERMKPRTVEPSAEQRRYHDWLRGDGHRERMCEACGSRLDTVIHHILGAAPGKVGRRDHWYVVLICAPCHNGRTDSVHGLGSEAKFLDRVLIDLVAISVARLKEYRNE